MSFLDLLIAMVANLIQGSQRHVTMKQLSKTGVSGNHGNQGLFLQVKHVRMAQDSTEEIRQEIQPLVHEQ